MQDIWICVTYPFFSLFTAGPKKAKKDLLTCLRHTYDYFDTDPGQNDAIYADGQPDFVSVRQITMCLCWIFSIFIAPVGLAYLYYYHSRGD
ncbi:TPA: hypothetical protein G8L61_000730 [Salmonella enterica]|uniref:Uncharacterized protein n=1 Tax=Salmonella enterica TaxID=28901 RepID=A0A744GNP5_SALER|nr:hypothetical protein [Salmonella enterica]HAF2587070.1 hypothetical protein [Salmonella enterica]